MAMSEHPDKAIILDLGGPKKVAQILGYDHKPGGVNRVLNWMRRGIPAQVKVDFPHLFMQPAPAASDSPAVPDPVVVSRG